MSAPGGHSGKAVDASVDRAARPRFFSLEPGRVRWRTLFLGLELGLFFFAMPVALALDMIPVPEFVVNAPFGLMWTPLIMAGALVCVGLLLRDHSFDWAVAFDVTGLRARFWRMCLTALILGALYAAFILAVSPDALFWLIRRSPAAWLSMTIAYPFASVLPQELVYRTFFFHRYRRLFSSRAGVAVFSVVAFSLMHSVFLHPTALAIGAVGGALFAYTYYRTRSLLAVAVEHTLYGWVMFIVGG